MVVKDRMNRKYRSQHTRNVGQKELPATEAQDPQVQECPSQEVPRTPKQKMCRLNTKTIKKMKEDYYIDWSQIKHITDFRVELDRGQEELLKDNIKISDEDKLQHYLEQIYDTGLFAKGTMNNYEDLDKANRHNASSVVYFKGLAEHMKKITKNNGSTAKASRLERAANLEERR